ncbi:CBO0543 family protein [Metabacillus sediminilitoris]|uniref:Uncharacterized protein n=1 Tax=Metabacillus sediminilitoris TaxID=2567941 RepID=A0A4S4C3L8_9BACI|nr:CBO0543 family protein [Metabacillus sediminilitoris]QGQ45351.1 hypothetical protein GMB29_08820 [Metabacillus sediminilitoris]THF82351.1 hypothetical protein E6W99_02655 [Metabacillus sediminilitoris]
MGHTFEKFVLKGLLIFSMVIFLPLVRKKPIHDMKDWLLVFFLKGYFSSFIDTFVVKKGFVKYPYNLFKIFDISVVFNYLIFPLSCIYFNQLTKKSNLVGVISKVLLFSIPMTIIETWFERNTDLIKYKKSWNWKYSFLSINATFLFVRLIIQLVRKTADGDSKNTTI